MEPNRKKQLFYQVDKAYKAWMNGIDQKSKVDDIEQTVEMISNKLAFGTVIVSGRGNPSSYIGTYRQCADLKKAFGGQIGVISNNWYWAGFANPDDIRKTVKNKQKNLQISIPANDIEEATLNIGEIASLDIRYGNGNGGRASYVGNYKVCILLRRKYGGKIGKLYNHWHWIGNAGFDEIELVYEDYQSKAKRFKRKKIVLNF